MFVSRDEMRKLYAIERMNKFKINQITADGQQIERTDKAPRS